MKCMYCGCTDERACPGGCYWAAPNVCSACVNQAPSRDVTSIDFRGEAEEREREKWALGEYDNGDAGCPKCGRFRLCICPNGKHRCEKCNWVPEDSAYCPVSDL